MGLMKFGDRVAVVEECGDGRHLARVFPLDGEKPFCEWLFPSVSSCTNTFKILGLVIGCLALKKGGSC